MNHVSHEGNQGPHGPHEPGEGHDHHHETTIIINGQRKAIEGEYLTYEQVVRVVFPELDPNNTVYTVTYDRGPKDNREGSMSAGDKVKVQDRMIFNVTATGKS